MKSYCQNDLMNYKKLIRILRLNSMKEEEKNVRLSVKKTHSHK
jgi:hypothetical protein